MVEEASHFSPASMEIETAGESESRKPGKHIETQSDRGSTPSRPETCEFSPVGHFTTNPVKGFEEPVIDAENCSVVSDAERTQENDLESNPTSSKEMRDHCMLKQESEDVCFIPSPELKSNSMCSFFGADFVSALQNLGLKYNNLVKKYHVKNSEAMILQAKFESLINKCLQECQPRYETLEKKHCKDSQHLISEIEMLQAKCEALSNKCLQECEPKCERLKKFLAEESSERKRLYNELIELRGNIRVFCRSRPLNIEEISKSFTPIVEFDPFKDTELQITCVDSSKKTFKFDHVFGPKDDQEAVFVETLPVVKSVMDGFNACLFAYGQTGTGKTFTMEGTLEYRGVNYRALEELFRIANERKTLMQYEFSFSMLEVYNEKIRDLLTDDSDLYGKKLDIKQSAEGTLEIPGLSEGQVCNIDEVWEMLKSGGRNRAVGSTNANELSSRSHCLVRVTIKGENLVSRERSKSYLWLVDLAGSERLGKVEAEGERLKESQFINKSLSALGDVISALASKSSHIPYRNSKLTHLLQSSLGGDCKTLMFAHISPSAADLGESLCTLNFASRVRGVEHGPARKQFDPSDGFKLKQMTEKLQQKEKEVNKLSESLQLLQIKYQSRENVFKTQQEKIRESEQAYRSSQIKIKELENQLLEEKKARIQPKHITSFRAPLAPANQRTPLARITNPPAPLVPHRSSAKTTNENKENAYVTIGTNRVGRARRISLTPVVCKISRTKQRASMGTEIDTLPLLSEKQHLNYVNGTTQLSQLRVPRRRSVATCAPFSDISHGNRKFSSSLKYSSHSQLQTMWKSSLPSCQQNQGSLTAFPPLPETHQIKGDFSSSHHTMWKSKLPSFPSQQQKGSGNSVQPMNKLCYSIQKRVIMGSPAQARPNMPLEPRFNLEALKAKEITGRFVAQRVLRKNRRNSVI